MLRVIVRSESSVWSWAREESSSQGETTSYSPNSWTARTHRKWGLDAAGVRVTSCCRRWRCEGVSVEMALTREGQADIRRRRRR